MTQTAPRIDIVDNQSSQTDLRICLRAPSEVSGERPALDLLMRIVDDGMSTRLYHRICDDQGLCYDVSAGYDGYEDDGVVDFAAGVQHKRVPQVTREILDLMTELAETGPTDEEVDKAKRRHAWDVDAMQDSPEETAGLLGRTVMLGRLETPATEIASMARVTKGQVRDVARALCDPRRLTVVAVGAMDARDRKRLEETVLAFRGAAS